jgi:hypothetical protein
VIDARLPPALVSTGFHLWGETPFLLLLILSVFGVRGVQVATLRRKT